MDQIIIDLIIEKTDKDNRLSTLSTLSSIQDKFCKRLAGEIILEIKELEPIKCLEQPEFHLSYDADLGDIGNAIGDIVGRMICKDGVEVGLFGFTQEDFLNGFRHGFSKHNGTH